MTYAAVGWVGGETSCLVSFPESENWACDGVHMSKRDTERLIRSLQDAVNHLSDEEA